MGELQRRQVEAEQRLERAVGGVEVEPARFRRRAMRPLRGCAAARSWLSPRLGHRDSPPHRAEGASPTRRGEGLGVGGIPNANVLQSPPPCPSPTRGEGTTLDPRRSACTIPRSARPASGSASPASAAAATAASGSAPGSPRRNRWRWCARRSTSASTCSTPPRPTRPSQSSARPSRAGRATASSSRPRATPRRPPPCSPTSTTRCGSSAPTTSTSSTCMAWAPPPTTRRSPRSCRRCCARRRRASSGTWRSARPARATPSTPCSRAPWRRDAGRCSCWASA